jgi:ABC-type phosphate transport system permease subunit
MKLFNKVIFGYRHRPIRCVVGCFGLFFIAALFLNFFAPELSGQSTIAAPKDENYVAFWGQLLTAVLMALAAIISPIIYVRE